MMNATSLKAFFPVLIVVLLVNGVTVSALAQTETKKPKSFAVFVISYKKGGSEAVGGVAGTAFFVSPTKAITAFHVLQEQSFRPQAGFDRARVWLVHENHAPVELALSDIAMEPDRDLTVIRVSKDRAVRSAFVYDMADDAATRFASARGAVSTEGFVANTTGPRFGLDGEDVTIVSVPRLERLQSRGHLLRKARVDLSAADVVLKSASCLEVSYKPVRGLSGGPVLVDGRVVGMNSFADPASAASTWALEIAK